MERGEATATGLLRRLLAFDENARDCGVILDSAGGVGTGIAELGFLAIVGRAVSLRESLPPRMTRVLAAERIGFARGVDP